MNLRSPIGIALPAMLLCAGLVQAASIPEQQASHVLNRLAYGPRPGDIERVAQMGVARYIDQQLHPEAIPMPVALDARLGRLDTVNRSAGASLAEFAELRKQVRDEGEDAKKERRTAVVHMQLQADEARLARAIDSPRQLEEVMVDFWFNHFNVFSGKGVDRALVASYEREAIRPYVFGSFRDLLGATAKHPAMLYYLDNHLSTANGYTPRGAQSKARGLNENYARELMELHTLGVDGGYTQKDVTELARMLTGWTYDPRALVRKGELFHFDTARHDQGSKQWLGRSVAAAGQREGEMALDVLAVHSQTARHISYQLAQYFVQDEPPAALVERMARSWIDSGGNIRAVLATLFASEEFMAPAAQGAKFKTPYQFVVSSVRAAALPVANVAPLVQALNQLGMPLYGCQTPDGYKNTQVAWLSPDALSRRISFATALAAGKLALPAAVASAPALQAALGPSVTERTLAAVAAQPEPLRAAMLLGSPDFMQH